MNVVNKLCLIASHVMHGQDRASLVVLSFPTLPALFSLPAICRLLFWVYSAHVSCKATCVGISACAMQGNMCRHPGQQAADPLLCRYWELDWEIVIMVQGL